MNFKSIVLASLALTALIAITFLVSGQSETVQRQPLACSFASTTGPVERIAIPRVAAATITTRRIVPTEEPTEVLLGQHPDTWTHARRDEVTRRITDRPTSTLIHAIRVRAAGGRLQKLGLRELQANLALRLAIDPSARASVERALLERRAGRIGAAWVRGALTGTR